jgi:hypothetical protein
MTTPQRDPQDVLTDLRREREAMLDPLDVPRTWTQRQLDAYEERRLALDAHINALRLASGKLRSVEGRLGRWIPARDRLVTAVATLTTQLEDSLKGRTTAGRGPRFEEQKQDDLRASLLAAHRGVEYFDGQPNVPHHLRLLLTDRCAACGSERLAWNGSLAALEARIAEDETDVEGARGEVECAVQSAEALLGATTVTA